jgi:predicted secreted protein
MFRDFSSGVDYSIAVTQRSTGEGSEIKSSLVLSVYRDTDTGEDKRYSVGMMTGYMQGRSGFQIKQVMLSPDSRFLLIVVQYEQYEEGGNDVRYMVRAVEL